MAFRPPGAPTNLSDLRGGPPPWIRTLVPSGASLVFYVTTTTDSSSAPTGSSKISSSFTSQTSSSTQTTFSSATPSAAPVSETRTSASASAPTSGPTDVPPPSNGVSPVWIGVATSLTVVVILLIIIGFLLFRRRRKNRASALESGVKDESSKNLRSELSGGAKTPQQLHGEDRKYELGMEERKYELAAEEKRREQDSATVSPLESVGGYGNLSRRSKSPPPYGVAETISPLSDRKSSPTSPTDGTQVHELDGVTAWYVPKNKHRPK